VPFLLSSPSHLQGNEAMLSHKTHLSNPTTKMHSSVKTIGGNEELISSAEI